MNLKFLNGFLLMVLSYAAFPISGQAQSLSDILYSKQDSLEVVSLLREEVGENDVLHYARHFLGRPYVAHTLEKSADEKLVVNLQEFDCTTLVEVVTALVLTKRQKSDSFADFCSHLERLRYWQGRRDGYVSRLHYFSWWISDNVEKGIVRVVEDSALFKGSFTVNNYYMSKYPERYKYLKGNKQRVWKIRLQENQRNGSRQIYLRKEDTVGDPQLLSWIQNGDIIAIVTEKPGLDYSHLGFAVWGKDRQLHLLNASSVYHQVVEDHYTISQYLSRNRTSKGVRFLRIQ